MISNQDSAPISDPQEIASACEKAIQLITDHYVETPFIDDLTTLLKNNLRQNVYQEILSYSQLAQRLTQDLRNLTNDRHLFLEVAPEKRTNEATMSQNDWQHAELVREQELNFGFTELAILGANIGYLKLEEFMNPERGIDTAIAAMKFLENTDSLIIDLRQNGGGYGGLAEYLVSYFFEEEPRLLSTTYFREIELTTQQTYTYPFIVGKRRVSQSLFLLVDKKTGSAAEWFVYTLQAFKKGTVVGEVTVGAANRNSYFDVNQHLRLSLSTGKPVSEATKENWEGKGITPDINCAASEAKMRAWEEARRLQDSKDRSTKLAAER
jgi:hypothetical protein